MPQDIKYTIYHTKRKGLLLKLKNDGSLALYCPKGYPKRKALEFIVANREKMALIAVERKKRALLSVFGEDILNPTLLYLGKRYPVQGGSVKRLSFDGESFTAPSDVSSEELLTLYRAFLREEAKKTLPPLVKALAEEHGFSYGRVFIKSTSSRFGSCSSRGNINLSLSLPAFDTEFVRFIVLHELAHTVHFDHGREFHVLLEKICPSHRLTEAKFKKQYSELARSICP